MTLLLRGVILTVLCVVFGVGCSDSTESVPGYIEGEYTYIASGVSGTLLKLFVTRGESIKQSTLLYQLDPEPEKSTVSIAKSNIGDLQAQVDFAKIQLERQRKLYLKNVAAKSALDEAQKEFDSKSHELAANEAQLVHSEWGLKQKTVYAPVTGEVFDTFYRIGEKVQENHPVLALLAPENIKVLFYIPETKLSQIKIGQKILFSCDGCKEKTSATITYISPEAEFTPPVIYSKDTRYKLVYLIRAAMPAEIAQQFHPGQPIEVYLRYE